MHAHALPTAVDRDVQQGKGAKAQETTVQNAPVVQRIGEPVLPWLPGGLRGIWIKLLQEAAQLYWPRTLARTRPGLVEAVLEGASAIEPAAREVFRKVTAPAFPWASYGASFETVLCKNYKDAALRERLEALGRSEPGAVLFTGGGLLPRSLLALEGLRFLHVHPGALPDVRGAIGGATTRLSSARRRPKRRPAPARRRAMRSTSRAGGRSHSRRTFSDS